MHVRFGNIHPVTAIKVEIDPAGHSLDELKEMAEARDVDLEGATTKEMIAARLSAKPHFRNLPGGVTESITEVHVAPGRTLSEAFNEITHATAGLWRYHSGLCATCKGARTIREKGANQDIDCPDCRGMGVDPPEWVEADDEALELMLSRHFGCERGAPSDAAERFLGFVSPAAQRTPDAPVEAEEVTDAD